MFHVYEDALFTLSHGGSFKDNALIQLHHGGNLIIKSNMLKFQELVLHH